MKILVLTISALTITAFSFSQADSTLTDDNLKKDLVGTWTHVTSTDPKGNVLAFDRQIELLPDGKGTCTKYVEADTLLLPFEWDIKDGAIQLYVFNKHGKRINTDSQFISLLDDRSLYLDTVYGSDDRGKVSLYQREDVAAKY